MHLGTLHSAALKGDLETLRALLAESPARDVDERDAEGFTPLFLAVRAGHKEVAAALLDAKADATVRDSEQQTLLHLASRRGDAAMLSLLLSKRPDLDVSPLSAMQKTPLWVSRGPCRTRRA